MNDNSRPLLSYSLSISFDILALLATDLSGGFLFVFKKIVEVLPENSVSVVPSILPALCSH